MGRVIALSINHAGHRHHSRLGDSTFQAADVTRVGLGNGDAQLVATINNHRPAFCIGPGCLIVARFTPLVAKSTPGAHSSSAASGHLVRAPESF